jgi:hypothetical protein
MQALQEKGKRRELSVSWLNTPVFLIVGCRYGRKLRPSVSGLIQAAVEQQGYSPCGKKSTVARL